MNGTPAPPTERFGAGFPWAAALLAAAILVTLSSPAPAEASEPAPAPQGLTILWMPPAEFHPQYTADPLRPQSALAVLGVLDSDIPDAGAARFALRLGGRFGLVRWHPPDRPDLGWQLDFEGGFFGHFDITESLDNIGWDGLFGLSLAWRPSSDLSFRVATRHDSAHVGDEYAARTGRERIGYTREEIAVGAAWALPRGWTGYAEGGFGYGLEPFQEAGRLQVGVQRVGRQHHWQGRAAWFSAVDVQAFQERDWRPALTVQLGFVAPTGHGSSRYRLALEAGSGRSALGEFSFEDESYIGVGWYFDF